MRARAVAVLPLEDALRERAAPAEPSIDTHLQCGGRDRRGHVPSLGSLGEPHLDRELLPFGGRLLAPGDPVVLDRLEAVNLFFADRVQWRGDQRKLAHAIRVAVEEAEPALAGVSLRRGLGGEIGRGDLEGRFGGDLSTF